MKLIDGLSLESQGPWFKLDAIKYGIEEVDRNHLKLTTFYRLENYRKQYKNFGTLKW